MPPLLASKAARSAEAHPCFVGFLHSLPGLRSKLPNLGLKQQVHTLQKFTKKNLSKKNLTHSLISRNKVSSGHDGQLKGSWAARVQEHWEQQQHQDLVRSHHASPVQVFKSRSNTLYWKRLETKHFKKHHPCIQNKNET